MRDPPENETLLRFHARLLSGDRVASNELTRLVLPFLLDDITRHGRNLDEQLTCDGVIDAVLDYCSNPQQFDAELRIPLVRFLANAAWRNVQNLLTSERRRKVREKTASKKKPEASVAFDPEARNIQLEAHDQADKKRNAMLEALSDPKDREILLLKLDGVREHDRFAQIMDLTHLPTEQQRAEVKRRKDRITRLLRRKGLLP